LTVADFTCRRIRHRGDYVHWCCRLEANHHENCPDYWMFFRKLVEPVYGPTTQFGANTGPRLDGMIPEAYAPFAQRILASFAQPEAVTTHSDVANVVWRAVNDTAGHLRFPAGANAVALTQSK
jgi:hypothetical protein